jgi:hypothetical protein
MCQGRSHGLLLKNQPHESRYRWSAAENAPHPLNHGKYTKTSGKCVTPMFTRPISVSLKTVCKVAYDHLLVGVK